MSCHVIVRNRLSLSMGSRGVAAGANPSLVSGQGQGTPCCQLIAGPSLMSNVGFSILQISNVFYILYLYRFHFWQWNVSVCGGPFGSCGFLGVVSVDPTCSGTPHGCLSGWDCGNLGVRSTPWDLSDVPVPGQVGTAMEGCCCCEVIYLVCSGVWEGSCFFYA